MNNISLKSIKYESIKAIINAISEADRISRAEISEKTDLSLVTVGKIADALLERNVVTQVKEVRSQAGRRAGLLSINPERFALILDFTRYQFRCAILNLRPTKYEIVPVPALRFFVSAIAFAIFSESSEPARFKASISTLPAS